MGSPQDDSDLCHDVFARLLARSLQQDASSLTDPERTVLLVGQLIGVLEQLEDTARALRRIDADQVAAAFEENRLGRDAALATIKACLAEYIGDHVSTFEVTDDLPLAEIVEPAAAPAGKERGADQTERRALPHWARVAFAAHCARSVFPLLSRYWPRIPMERAARIRYAIDAAAGSAAQAKAQADLNFLVVEMMAMAGAALVGASGIAPPDTHSATIASFIAKVAEKAADAARTPADKSATPVNEAFAFAEQAASETPDLAKLLKRERRILVRAATRAGWDDDTPLAVEELEKLLTRDERKPWWKRW